MNINRIFLSGLTVFSLTIMQMDVRLVYAVEEEHEGHKHGSSHGASYEEDSHDEHGHGEKEQRYEEESHDGHDDAGEGPGGHDDHGEEGIISLDEEARAMIQLQTEEVSKRNLGGHLKVYGKIAKDTENYAYIAFDGEGKVEAIQAGLGNIVNQEAELLTIRKDDGTIEQIKSEMHGVVLSIFVKPGDKVDSLTSLLSIIDVDTLRATIDIYERDLSLVRVGQKVMLTTAAYPNKKFDGEVVYISPQVDEHTQAIKVRVDINNPQHLLRLGMFVSGELFYTSDKKVTSVPSTAIQQINGEDIVFVAGEGNNLKLKEVVLGRSVNDYVEVIEGLNTGEIVVTQGSFYLKSEQAKEAFGDGHNH